MARIIRTTKPKSLDDYIWNENTKQWILNSKITNWECQSEQNRITKTSLKSELMKMCNNSCPFSFTRFPPELFFEIEHFRPKSKFPELTFEWSNLFPIYRFLNTKKSSNWDNKLLNPETEDYMEYFIMNKKLDTEDYCKIEIRRNLSNDQVERAKKTIEIYCFNDPQLIEARKFWFELIEIKINPYPFAEYF